MPATSVPASADASAEAPLVARRRIDRDAPRSSLCTRPMHASSVSPSPRCGAGALVRADGASDSAAARGAVGEGRAARLFVARVAAAVGSFGRPQSIVDLFITAHLIRDIAGRPVRLPDQPPPVRRRHVARVPGAPPRSGAGVARRFASTSGPVSPEEAASSGEGGV